MNDCILNWHQICINNANCVNCKDYLSANSTEGRLLAEELERQIDEVREIWRKKLIK